MKKLKIIGIIPARLKSTRLPEKMLLDIYGKPLVYYTYSNAVKSRLDDVIIAADDQKLYRQLKKFNCQVIMTSKKHKSGTDRVGEAAFVNKADFYVNIQGDEPLIKPKILNKIKDYLIKYPETEIVTVGKRITDRKEINNPNVVKIVCGFNHYALYFSRACIPFNRDRNKEYTYIKHFGIYAYRADVLKKVIKIKSTKLEQIEKLEQLRFLEHGFKIKVLILNYDSIGVDSLDDFRKVKNILKP